MSLFEAAQGKLYSLPVTTPADASTTTAQETKGDASLPDPTRAARTLAALLGLAAVGVALLWNLGEATRVPFDPAKVSEANFALFAGFYVAALLIERAGELIAPQMPPWPAPLNAPPAPGSATPGPVLDADARAAHTKADRALLMLAVNFVLGVILSCAVGLYFMTAIGMEVSRTVDAILTGLVIAGGTQKLHAFISMVQKKDAPKTGTGSD